MKSVCFILIEWVFCDMRALLLSHLDTPALLDLGAKGVSHHDRRRSRDKFAPCESVKPLDTTDDDCYTMRWNLMVGYFPAHLGLKQMDNKIVQGETEVESTWSNIESQLAQSLRAVNDLLPESKTLVSSAGQLQRASIASIDTVSRTQIKFAQKSIEDMRNLKTFLAAGINDLSNKTNTAIAFQAKSQKRNAERMNARSSAALRDSVELLVGQQKNLSSVVVKSQAKFEAYNSEFEKNITGIKLEPLHEALASMEDTSVLTRQSITKAIETGTDWVDSETGRVNGIVGKKQIAIVSDFTSEGSGQFDDARQNWRNMSSTVLHAVQSQGDSAMNLVANNMSAPTGASADRLELQLQFGLSQVEGNTKQAVDSAAAVARDTAARGAEMDAWATDVDSQAIELEAGTQSEFNTAMRSKKFDQAEGMPRLISALASAQAQSHSSLEASESASADSAASLLGSVGEAGVDSADQLGKLAQSIDSTKRIASPEVSVNAKEGTLMKAMDIIGELLPNLAVNKIDIPVFAANVNLSSELGHVQLQSARTEWDLANAQSRSLGESNAVAQDSRELGNAIRGDARAKINLKDTARSLAATDSDADLIYLSQLARSDDRVDAAILEALKQIAARVNHTQPPAFEDTAGARKQLAAAKTKQDQLIAKFAQAGQRSTVLNSLSVPDQLLLAPLTQEFDQHLNNILSRDVSKFESVDHLVDQAQLLTMIGHSSDMTPSKGLSNDFASDISQRVSARLGTLSSSLTTHVASPSLILESDKRLVTDLREFVDNTDAQSVALQTELNSAKSVYGEKVLNVSRAISSELRQLGTVGVGDSSVTSRLNAEMLRLSEQVAVGNVSALPVLIKLKAIQANLSAANAMISSNISDLNEGSTAAFAAVAALRAGIAALSDDLDTPSTWESEDMRLLLGKVLSRAGLYASKTESELAGNVTSNLFARSLPLNASTILETEVTSGFSNLTTRMQNQTDFELRTSNISLALSRVAASSGRDIMEIVANVLQRMRATTSMTAEDVAAQLIVMRRTLQSFISLGAEYGESVNAGLASVVRGDEDFIRTIALDAQTELDSDAQTVAAARRSMVISVPDWIASSETEFRGELEGLSSSLASDTRSQLLANLTTELDHAMNQPNKTLIQIWALLNSS